MALIYCRECGNQISDKAERCPHCGMVMYNIQPPPTYDMMTSEEAKEDKLKKRNNIGWGVLAVGVLLLIIIYNVGMDEEQQRVLSTIVFIVMLPFSSS